MCLSIGKEKSCEFPRFVETKMLPEEKNMKIQMKTIIIYLTMRLHLNKLDNHFLQSQIFRSRRFDFSNTELLVVLEESCNKGHKQGKEHELE